MTTNQSESSISVTRVRIDSLSVYEISDYELAVFESGNSVSTFLNFAILFSSIGLSFLATLLTVDIESIRVFSVFVILVIASLIAAVVLFVLWWQGRSQTAELCKKIRKRAPPTLSGDVVGDSAVCGGFKWGPAFAGEMIGLSLSRKPSRASRP